MPIDSRHGADPAARLTLIYSLMASKGWMRGYAEAFVDNFADAQKEQCTVATEQGIMPYDAMESEMAKTWAQEQAKQITEDLQNLYGRGFDLLSTAQQDALVAEQVLFLVLRQYQAEFAPLQEMARSVLAELHTSFKP